MVMLNVTSRDHSVFNNNRDLTVFSLTQNYTHTHTTTALQCPGQQTVWVFEGERERERERILIPVAETQLWGWLYPFGAFSVKLDRSLGLDLMAWLSQGYFGLSWSGRTECWSRRDPFLCHPLLQQPALAIYRTPLRLAAGADPAPSVSQWERERGWKMRGRIRKI